MRICTVHIETLTQCAKRWGFASWLVSSHWVEIALLPSCTDWSYKPLVCLNCSAGVRVPTCQLASEKHGDVYTAKLPRFVCFRAACMMLLWSLRMKYRYKLRVKKRSSPLFTYHWPVQQCLFSVKMSTIPQLWKESKVICMRGGKSLLSLPMHAGSKSVPQGQPKRDLKVYMLYWGSGEDQVYSSHEIGCMTHIWIGCMVHMRIGCMTHMTIGCMAHMKIGCTDHMRIGCMTHMRIGCMTHLDRVYGSHEDRVYDSHLDRVRTTF